MPPELARRLHFQARVRVYLVEVLERGRKLRQHGPGIAEIHPTDVVALERVVRTDNGPKFTSRAFIGWAQSHGIRHILIEPGRPMQNGYIESFNGRFRDECPNEHWFLTLQQARQEIAAWRLDYNELRPHGSIGRMPPARFAEQHRRHACDAARHLTPANNEIQ